MLGALDAHSSVYFRNQLELVVVSNLVAVGGDGALLVASEVSIEAALDCNLLTADLLECPYLLLPQAGSTGVNFELEFLCRQVLLASVYEAHCPFEVGHICSR